MVVRLPCLSARIESRDYSQEIEGAEHSTRHDCGTDQSNQCRHSSLALIHSRLVHTVSRR